MKMRLLVHEHGTDRTEDAREQAGALGPAPRDQRPYVPSGVHLGAMNDLELEYSPSSRVGGSAEPFVADYRARSAAVRDELGDRIVRLAGGSLLVAGEPNAPLLVFIHGGYWQALSAEESLYLATGALAQGWSYLAVEYTIAPVGNLVAMLAECHAVLSLVGPLVGPLVGSLVGSSPASSLCPQRVVLAGHSAGAHLAAMVSLVRPSPLPIDLVVLLSGVFDLRPLVRTSVNDPLGLDDSAASSLSPLLLPHEGGSEAVIAWGDNETDAFKAQSGLYAAYLAARGVRVSTLECAPRHHFDIVDDLVDPHTPLGRLTRGGSA